VSCAAGEKPTSEKPITRGSVVAGNPSYIQPRLALSSFFGFPLLLEIQATACFSGLEINPTTTTKRLCQTLKVLSRRKTARAVKRATRNPNAVFWIVKRLDSVVNSAQRLNDMAEVLPEPIGGESCEGRW